jgi:hypothetical protein
MPLTSSSAQRSAGRNFSGSGHSLGSLPIALIETATYVCNGRAAPCVGLDLCYTKKLAYPLGDEVLVGKHYVDGSFPHQCGGSRAQP